ncbi:YqaA family protein [Vitiosangium sp. GDMCC 1.1324]|uniref:YqaA family protein n=1 Tax=Vitiosangium sp. (strain GDMCC 1.1324) TaxID=2138576 RepID=UPI000D3C244A|nr:VTT domain-containing protein [Vitiosangium sp. GDMCC 1.1324]PTL83072.1 DedA family protein [Vitiosangium sp. GDMCC 1.1324]
MTDPSPVAAPPAKLSWYRRLYLRVEALSSTKHALAAMLVVSVVDGSVFPIPPFALLVPMVLAQPRKWLQYALLGTVASLFGGFIGYYLGTLINQGAIGFLHIDLNATINSPRLGIENATVGDLLGRNFWVLSLLCSILPTPFKVVAIGSGMVGVPLDRFFLAAVLGRSVRFFLVSGVMRFFGPTARKWLRV